jgi:two-component sensor histidine kinase
MRPFEPSAHAAMKHASDDALILHEFSHRTANHIAAAAAALHLVKVASGDARNHLIVEAIERLNALGQVHRLLARPVGAEVDVAPDLATICEVAVKASSATSEGAVTLDAPPTWLPGAVARRVSLVAAELVANAVRHALEGRAGRLHVSLKASGDEVALMVRDDGPGMRPGAATSGTGLGSGIVSELVSRAGGTIAVETGPAGTTVQVTLPLRFGPDSDEWVIF